MQLNFTLKNRYNGKFCYVYFTTLKKHTQLIQWGGEITENY